MVRVPKLPGGTVRWSRSATAAIIDQGLYGLSNLVVNLALARWLTVEDYGAFSVGYAVFLLFGTVHTGLLSDPMLVFASVRYSGRIRAYLGVVVWLHAAFSVLTLALLLVTSSLVSEIVPAELRVAMISFGCIIPIVLLVWLLRRASYAMLRPSTAAFGSGLYFSSVVGGLYAIRITGMEGLVSGVIVMGFASCIPALWLVWRLRPDFLACRRTELASGVLFEHAVYGRWAVGVGLLGWIPVNAYYLLIPIWVGFSGAGVLKATMNLVVPILQMFTAVSTLMQAVLARKRDSKMFDRIVYFHLMVLTAIGLVYWGGIVKWYNSIVKLIYDGRYAEFEYLVWILGGICLAKAVSDVAEASLRALERPDLVFSAYIVSTSVALTIGVILVAIMELTGAALGIVFATSIGAVTMLTILRRERRLSSTRSTL